MYPVTFFFKIIVEGENIDQKFLKFEKGYTVLDIVHSYKIFRVFYNMKFSFNFWRFFFLIISFSGIGIKTNLSLEFF